MLESMFKLLSSACFAMVRRRNTQELHGLF